jgi:membrane protein implicated in regulation of membrane protease activity
MPGANQAQEGGNLMLWLIAGIVLLIIAIAGGAIVHPVLFALAIVALVVFFMGRGTRTV